MTTETKELTTIERAEQALGLATLRPQLEALVKKSANIQTITNKAGRDECHAALMVLKNQRISIEKTGKEAREEATRYSKAVIAAEKTLVDILSPEEDRLAAIRQQWDDARAAEKAEEERIERESVAAMAKRIADIEALPGKLFGAGVEAIKQAITDLDGDDLDGLDEVYLPSAEKAKAETMGKLHAAYDERIELDRQAAENLRLQQEREAQAKAEAEELARQRAAFEAEQAEARKAQEEADRKAEEARAEADRKAQEQRRAEAEALAEERRKLDEQLAAHRAELAAQQSELDRRDREGQESARVAAAARDAVAAQEAAEREAEAIRTASLQEVVTEALIRLRDVDGTGDLLVRKMERVLSEHGWL